MMRDESSDNQWERLSTIIIFPLSSVGRAKIFHIANLVEQYCIYLL